MKECECGCGESVKNERRRFVHGHHNRTPEHWATLKRGPDSPNWKADADNYSTIHRWLHRTYPKTGVCELCGREHHRTEFANLSGEYRREREDYMEMCPSCHRRFDKVHYEREEEHGRERVLV